MAKHLSTADTMLRIHCIARADASAPRASVHHAKRALLNAGPSEFSAAFIAAYSVEPFHSNTYGTSRSAL